jgi:acyl-CoA reductase-like NAD-dependent aldehyde dehydrogenase
MKTCGVIEDDEQTGIQKVAEPIGVICGVVPTTNPGATAIFKSLVALKVGSTGVRLYRTMCARRLLLLPR